MSETKWNPGQQQVIESRRGNVLVSAAAGSGKTAVLIERIMRTVQEEKADVNEFLIVTFTNAAAQQLREKISGKIEKAVKENPEDSHMVKQLSLIRRADITTIDSFCLKVVKENFNVINIDPSFNIVDEKLMDLTKSDILDEIFAERYEAAYSAGDSVTEEAREKAQSFVRFAEAFGQTVNDDDLKSVILNVMKKASSYPYPDEWLGNAKKAVDINSPDELNEAVWLKAYLNDAKKIAASCLEKAEKAMGYCTCEGGCKNNLQVAEADTDMFRLMLKAETYDEMAKALGEKMAALKAVRKDGPEKENYLLFKAARDEYKKEAESVKKGFRKSTEIILYELENIKGWIFEIVDLCMEFEKRLDAEKKKTRQYEFADIEHMALQILTGGRDAEGGIISSEAARSIAASYRQIYIDEYQDSNFLQEAILTAVSGYRDGEKNIFMVGDVKQSIYRFRMARPDLFMEKYERYEISDTDGPAERRIDLMKNYRSRQEVLSAVNYVFSIIMHKDLGGIEYDDTVYLNYGGRYPECEADTYKTEMLIIDTEISDETEDEAVTAQEGGQDDTNPRSDSGDEEEEELEKLEYEARLVAAKIKEMTDKENGLVLWDFDTEEYRRAEYKDVVILLRSIKNKGDVFARVLEQQGIPAFLDNPNGYFDAAEVSTILSMLKVADNIRQDIPLAAVITSPMAGLDESDLSVITGYCISNNISCRTLYDRCMAYLGDTGVSGEIKSKLEKIMGIISELKEKKAYLSISQLIKEILRLTGYDIYAASMPVGEKRIANINMLMEKADKYEQGNYKGLFNFLRYVEKLRIHDIDFGEASNVSDTDNVVRITTMHKSKGLEYPIAFVSCLGAEFNTADTKDDPVIHSDYYLASRYINLSTRRKNKSFIRDAIIRLTMNDNLAEEQRVLYVAMTRAMQKLILTGTMGKRTKRNEAAGYAERSSAKSFLEWLYTCAVYDSRRDSGGCMDMQIYSKKDVISLSKASLNPEAVRYTDAKDAAEAEADKGYVKALKQEYEYIYPYTEATARPVKVSVSDVKRAHMAELYDEILQDGETMFHKEKDVPVLITRGKDLSPEEAASDDGGRLSGAERGTAIHRIMELLDYSLIDTKDDMKKEVERLLATDKFSERERKLWGMNHVYDFFDSPLFGRMKAGFLSGLLKREKQFIISLPADMIYRKSGTGMVPETAGTPDGEKPDSMIMQGIIDAYIEEPDGIVLIDYKTDKRDAEALAGMYGIQMDLYAETLSRLTGKKVKEKVLYSFYLDREVRLPH